MSEEEEMNDMSTYTVKVVIAAGVGSFQRSALSECILVCSTGGRSALPEWAGDPFTAVGQMVAEVAAAVDPQEPEEPGGGEPAADDTREL